MVRQFCSTLDSTGMTALISFTGTITGIDIGCPRFPGVPSAFVFHGVKELSVAWERGAGIAPRPL
ncbi:hypothetical protein COO72_05420 [Bifidobacterium callitrichos]|nr:hypothetical protein COO72_05420 [Bifidobacterium callitrichos]